MEYSNVFVCLMGMGTVFLGLVCIIVLCSLMSAVIRAFSKKEPDVPAVSADEPIKDRAKKIAAVSAVIAEELKTDVSAIRIKSFKKVK